MHTHIMLYIYTQLHTYIMPISSIQYSRLLARKMKRHVLTHSERGL